MNEIRMTNVREPTMNLKWQDAEELAIRLVETHPDVDPLTVRFTDLHKWITGLDGFTGDPAASTEAKLEAVQMAWLDEWKDGGG
mgnify:CR=1 FL=1